ncbi:TIGR01777 family oxidoreductase [Ferrimonas lipolytica]|uniref:TIGR01777 family protein n=1 Tax=Ferrimonas lipolytica TaxID=2724191 RepID=A0A6H1U9W2_9GAMM|nr:TIGR01777 family oxidoreductase [Ferrimonas lipolytica]QIZ75845.1 TIGR01777 family protein [Ferrimonas lipolytica]
MRILLTGATGFIGTALVSALADHQLTVLSRDPVKAKQKLGGQHHYLGNLEQLESLADFDAIINLAGEPIGDGRWTPQRKQAIETSRWQLTTRLTKLFFAAQQRPTTWINASAIGVYGPRDSSPVDESGPTGNDFAASVCTRWEAIASKVAQHTRLCIVRIGLVMHPDGGALAKMLPPFKMGGGGQIGSGSQMMSWIHRQDMIDLVIYLLGNKEADGLFNATAPTPVSNKQFVQALGHALHRPSVIPIPAAAMKLMFGEMSTLLLTGQAVLPRATQHVGFQFSFPTIEQCFSDLFRK